MTDNSEENQTQPKVDTPAYQQISNDPLSQQQPAIPEQQYHQVACTGQQQTQTESPQQSLELSAAQALAALSIDNTERPNPEYLNNLVHITVLPESTITAPALVTTTPVCATAGLPSFSSSALSNNTMNTTVTTATMTPIVATTQGAVAQITSSALTATTSSATPSPNPRCPSCINPGADIISRDNLHPNDHTTDVVPSLESVHIMVESVCHTYIGGGKPRAPYNI
ncbi:hypothetical protein QAD02_007139 [Eretmocerus hayati]|uniref:Uncharacterized protein n=1 Tax=Eretmocerus hayati TaxID=131215 RepID=A0ACC2N2V0_9HYME|nr:hypothetical protein QAD02_007139 [Eretmocerus hayati]